MPYAPYDTEDYPIQVYQTGSLSNLIVDINDKASYAAFVLNEIPLFSFLQTGLLIYILNK